MANAAMLIVAYFSALLLNFGDFARFGKDEAAMKTGNLLGLPVNFLVFSIITVIVTAGTLKVFGQAIMDPVLIVEKIGNPVVVIIGSITFIVATMGINIVANFVSPAYDISNLKPEKINFKMGGLITSILSVLVCPWLFVASPSAITLFVSIFGSVLGPMFGIMIADYYLVKMQAVKVEDLYTMSPCRHLQLRRRLEPQGPDRPGDLWGPVHRPVLARRLRSHVQRRRLGMAHRCERRRTGLSRLVRTIAFGCCSRCRRVTPAMDRAGNPARSARGASQSAIPTAAPLEHGGGGETDRLVPPSVRRCLEELRADQIGVGEGVYGPMSPGAALNTVVAP